MDMDFLGKHSILRDEGKWGGGGEKPAEEAESRRGEGVVKEELTYIFSWTESTQLRREARAFSTRCGARYVT